MCIDKGVLTVDLFRSLEYISREDHDMKISPRKNV
jgi:hypothetical protein